jgi:hypothetical protein
MLVVGSVYFAFRLYNGSYSSQNNAIAAVDATMNAPVSIGGHAPGKEGAINPGNYGIPTLNMGKSTENSNNKGVGVGFAEYPSNTPDYSLYVTPIIGDLWDGLGNININFDGYETNKAKVTHYFPPWGGDNCWQFKGGYCVSRMFSGLRWEDYVNNAVACPVEYSIGSWIGIDPYGNGITHWFQCLDRGGMIQCENDYCDVDILTDRPVDGFYKIKRKEN